MPETKKKPDIAHGIHKAIANKAIAWRRLYDDPWQKSGRGQGGGEKNWALPYMIVGAPEPLS